MLTAVNHKTTGRVSHFGPPCGAEPTTFNLESQISIIKITIICNKNANLLYLSIFNHNNNNPPY